MAFFPRIKPYKTSVSFLVANGLVGQQAVIESCYPSQKNLRDSDPIKAFDDVTENDFDPIIIDWERSFSENVSTNTNSELSKTE